MNGDLTILGGASFAGLSVVGAGWSAEWGAGDYAVNGSALRQTTFRFSRAPHRSRSPVMMSWIRCSPSASLASARKSNLPPSIEMVFLLTNPHPPGSGSAPVTSGALTLVSYVHVSTLLAGPGPSGSAAPFRRYPGCSRPPSRFRGQAALSFARLLRQPKGGALSSPLGFDGASWRTC